MDHILMYRITDLRNKRLKLDKTKHNNVHMA
jgi:hypothetical protein